MMIFRFLPSTCLYIFNTLGKMWQFFSSIFQFAATSEATVTASEVSMWRTLWNDLFSQVVRWHYNIILVVSGFIKDYPNLVYFSLSFSRFSVLSRA